MASGSQTWCCSWTSTPRSPSAGSEVAARGWTPTRTLLTCSARGRRTSKRCVPSRHIKARPAVMSSMPPTPRRPRSWQSRWRRCGRTSKRSAPAHPVRCWAPPRAAAAAFSTRGTWCGTSQVAGSRARGGSLCSCLARWAGSCFGRAIPPASCARSMTRVNRPTAWPIASFWTIHCTELCTTGFTSCRT